MERRREIFVKREEVGAVVLAAAIAGALGLVLALFGKALNTSVYFGSGSNLIQYVSGPATIGALAMAAWIRWHRTCAIPSCLRLGEHPVAGTLRKVCTHHHTLEHHRHVHDLQGHAHRATGRLGWGETHKIVKGKKP
jgi:hypothetical protein